ncbi:MAG: LacI family DNA-binding transcriptional regulator [Granulosicoccaceae bacterium]
MNRANKPTLEDVAKLAKVSTATISRSINEPDKVAGATRERIQSAISQLAYTPNFGAKILASNKSNTVGAIIPTMANAMFASGLHAFQQALANHGVLLLVASSGYNPEDEFEQIQTLLSHGADGLLLIGTERPNATHEFLEMRKIPYIISWCYQADSDKLYAGFDNKQSAYEIAKAVLDIGHRRIGMLAGVSQGNDRATNRIKGVTQAIDDFGNDAQLSNIVETAYTLEDGAQAFDKLMRGANIPTAVICGNDVIAAGALNRAKEIGLKVPADISITGFDDINLATAVDPQLTTVRVPQEQMGRAAARLLLDFVSSRKQPSSVQFETEVVMRDSLGPPNR